MNQPQLRLLLVADNGADYSALRAIPLIETVAYGEPAPALTSGADRQFDAMLLDGELLDRELVPQIAMKNPALPIILVARSDAQETMALEALERGADDYLMESELTPVSICGAVRNARRFRAMRQQRDEARRELAARSSAGVPQHLTEQLRTSLGIVEAFADTMDRQLDGHPAAGMAGALLDEVDRLQELTEDLSDSRRMLDGSVIVQRQSIQLGELAQQFLYRHAGRVADVRAGAQWDIDVICDHRKTLRAMSRLADSMQLAVPGAELELLVDETAPRIGIAIRGGEAPAETLQKLLDIAPVAAGDAGFQRTVALGLLECQQITVEADDQVIWFDLPGTTDSLTERWSNWLATQSLAPVTLFEVRLSRCDRSHAGESAADCEFDLRAFVERQVANEIAIGAEPEEQLWADTYLHQSLTARDLVFARGGNRWLVALAGGAHEAESRMHRLTATAVVVDSSHRLESELVATYHLPLETGRLQSRLGKLLGTSRRILLVDADPKPVSPVSRRLLEAGYDVVSLDESSQLQDAAAIVGDADSIETVEALRGRLPNIPVFLVGSLKDQQRILQQNVRFVNDNDDRYQDLLEALQQSSPAPLGWHHAPTREDDHELAASPFFLDGFEFATDGEPDASPF